MTTNNVISTPNITGNIGSCNVSSNEVKIEDGIFTAQYKVVQINSCTGEIIASHQYISYAGVWLTLVVGFFLLLVILSAASDNY